MKEYAVELTCEENKTCKLNFFLSSLDYVRNIPFVAIYDF